MNPAPAITVDSGAYELRFESLYRPGRALAFPCNARGQVELDTLSQPALLNYLYARTVIGREFAVPAIVRSQLH